MTLFYICSRLFTCEALLVKVNVLEGVTIILCFFCGVAPDDQQPLEGSEGGNPEQNSPNATTAPQVALSLYP